MLVMTKRARERKMEAIKTFFGRVHIVGSDNRLDVFDAVLPHLA
jgi:hypothetical protein